jgi:hypothetical protein
MERNDQNYFFQATASQPGRALESSELLTLRELLWTLQGKKQMLGEGTSLSMSEYLRVTDQIQLVSKILDTYNAA